MKYLFPLFSDPKAFETELFSTKEAGMVTWSILGGVISIVTDSGTFTKTVPAFLDLNLCNGKIRAICVL